ncbi:MAG: hypothetical protein ACREPR_26340, partial [Brasilonema sp.]
MDINHEQTGFTPDAVFQELDVICDKALENLPELKSYLIKDYRLEITDVDNQRVVYSCEFKTLEDLKASLKFVPPREKRMTMEEAHKVFLFAHRLPSENLLQRATNKEQRQEGAVLRKIAIFMGGCLFWQISKLDGDPIKELLSTGVPEHELLHIL